MIKKQTGLEDQEIVDTLNRCIQGYKLITASDEKKATFTQMKLN